MPTLITIVNFGSGIGGGGSAGDIRPASGFIMDGAGDLFGTVESSGSSGFGSVFEISKTSTGFANTPTSLVQFSVVDGEPSSGLFADAAGNLFDTTSYGNGDGTVFEIVNSAIGYSAAPITLASFDSLDGAYPDGPLVMDAAGNLFGTTIGGGLGDLGGLGTVFEIVKTISGYANTPTTLVEFNTVNGSYPDSGLIIDAAGNLFGTAADGGPNGDGIVFEISRTSTGYSTTPTTLATFNGANGAVLAAGLVADASGNLFGEAVQGGAYGYADGNFGAGTVFEIAKTSTGYASTPIVLVNFNGADGFNPGGGLIVDVAGDLFGTTSGGGAGNDGTVFEIVKTGTGYANVPLTLVNFNLTNGQSPFDKLIADASGDLFGTTRQGGANFEGTAFELKNAGFQVAGTIAPTISGTVNNNVVTDQAIVAPFSTVVISDINVGQTETVNVTLSAAVNGALSNLGGGTYDPIAGVYSDTGTAGAITAALDGLIFTPTVHQVAPGQSVTTTFTVFDTNTAGTAAFDNTTTVSAVAQASLTTLANFPNGDIPQGSLISDATGDLYGTTGGGGTNGDGTVFEIPRINGNYAAATVLVSFNSANGSVPVAGLRLDANGDIIGTTEFGGSNNDGTVFEIVKTSTGYASTPSTLANFNGITGQSPESGLITDASGNLIGTTSAGGVNGYGTVFEILKTAGGYAAAPTTLVNFNSTNGAYPRAGLFTDASGDLFGTTQDGGVGGDGTVFEITKTAGTYASAPTTLVSFNGANGSDPYAALITDAAGDLFGTTSQGGANNQGTVFEIAKNASGFASTPITLAAFNGANSGNSFAGPVSGLTADAVGDLFGTTLAGGLNGVGSVFEIVRTSSGYLATPTILYSFNGMPGQNPQASVSIDTVGNLFGTTGWAFGGDTVFELSDVGFQLTAPAVPTINAASSITLGSFHINVTASEVLSISNTAFEPIAGLDASIGGTTGNAIATGSFSLLAAGQTNATAITIGLDTSVVGARSGTVTVALASDVGGASSMLPPQTRTITGTVYRLASAQEFLQSNIVFHVGDSGVENLVVTNAAVADGFSESLRASVAGIIGTGFTASGTTGLIAASVNDIHDLTVDINTAASGAITGSVTLALTSDGTGTSGLAATALPSQSVQVSAAIYNYAQDTFELASGAGTLSHNGTAYTLAFGNIFQGATFPIAHLGVVNSATGLADTLSANFTVNGVSAFINSNFGGISGLSAGKADVSPQIILSTATTGSFSETIMLQGTSSNTIDTSALATETLTITANITTPSGDTVYRPGTGSNIFAGNGGVDHGMVMFTGPEAQYQIATSASGVTVTDSAPGRNGVTHLTNIEYLTFTDTTAIVANADNSQIALLYSTAFDRQPDIGGLDFWENTFASGLTSAVVHNPEVDLAENLVAAAGTSIANYFVASPEFQQDYGSLNDTAFVTQLYHNVLNRLPDAGGLSFWLGVMENGDANGVHYTRGMVLVGFSSSAENIANSTWLHMV